MILKRTILIISIVLSMVFITLFPADAQMNFLAHCFDVYKKTEKCPEAICNLECIPQDGKSECENVCLPKECTKIDVNACPPDFCNVMINCSEKETCYFKMIGEQAKCGDLAYAGQGVECCEGLVRRCGVEFLDGTCDMKGENSVYSLSICIPCGDDICGQFEDACNCPEDCRKGGLYGGFSFDEYVEDSGTEKFFKR